ncbi:MAG: hypothetical protein R2761_02960 [Acidimicrobiales bacterium]
MHLDNELRSLRPEVGQPSAAVAAGHRRALDAAIAEGRTARRRAPLNGRRRWMLTIAAVLAVIVAGGATWWATRSGDVRLDTGPTATSAETSTAQPATTALGATPGSASEGDQSTATTVLPPGGLDCGPGTQTGSSLPGFLQVLPDEAGAIGTTTFDGDGRLVTRRETERFVVEALWPAPDRQLYAADGTADGLGRADSDINYDLSPEGQTELVVLSGVGELTALRILISGAVKVAEHCRFIQFTVSEQGEAIARFVYDLAAGDGQAPIADRSPLVVETRQMSEAPAEALPCNGGPGAPPNDDLAANGPAAPTPAEALDAYLTTPAAATYYQSGYVEMVTPDGTYTYGAPIAPGSAEWVTLVTVSPVDGGWAATHATASGC